MNLDELQSVQARERQSSDLQHLRSSFYEEVGEFIEELRTERARVVDRADDPFSSPEVRRLTDDIETAEATVEAIYERRIGKVVKKASIAAADMPVEVDGLTAEENALFEDLVESIEENRRTVFSVIDGDAPDVSCSIDAGGARAPAENEGNTAAGTSGSRTDRDSGPEPTGDPTRAERPVAADDGPASADAGDSGVSAADLMGESEASARVPEPERSAPERPTEEPSPAGEASESGGNGTTDRVSDPPTRSEESTDRPENRRGRNTPDVPRTTVRITTDVGEVVGTDDRDYDLGAEDVVTLPEPNAQVLVEKDAAERLE